MKPSMETIAMVARAIAGHSDPSKAQLWEANAALHALNEAGLLGDRGIATQPAEKEPESVKTCVSDSVLTTAIQEAIAAWATGAISPDAIFGRLGDILTSNGAVLPYPPRSESVRRFMQAAAVRRAVEEK